MITSPQLDDTKLKQLLEDVHTIAVVGLSADTSKDSYRVASYLKLHGYRIIPVNPRAEEILAEKSYPDLKSIPEPIDVVDVFRRPEFLPAVADEAVSVRAKVLWMQEGIRNEEAAQKAASAGLTVVQDACMLKEHARLVGK
jgi:predicted CoA-binding protein